MAKYKFTKTFKISEGICIDFGLAMRQLRRSSEWAGVSAATFGVVRHGWRDSLYLGKVSVYSVV